MIVNEKGGVGKSRLATILAALAASDGVDVILLDADKQAASMSWCSARQAHGVEPLFPVLAPSVKAAREIESLGEKYQLVVVDVAGGGYQTIDECVQMADLVIVPCGADQSEVEATFRTLERIVTLAEQVPGRHIPAWVVLSRVPPHENSRVTASTRQAFETLLESLPGTGLELFPIAMTYRDAWKACGRTGRGLHELKGVERSEKAVEEIMSLYTAIKQFSAELARQTANPKRTPRSRALPPTY
jgi:chromosome partitioning protein